MAMVIMYEPGMRKMEAMSLQMAYSAAQVTADDIRMNVGVETGALKRSVRARKLKRSARVYIGTDHWFYHEYGVEPHIIRATTAKVLASNRTVFGKVVNHPGHRAYMPVRRAFYKRRSAAQLMIPEVF